MMEFLKSSPKWTRKPKEVNRRSEGNRDHRKGD